MAHDFKLIFQKKFFKQLVQHNPFCRQDLKSNSVILWLQNNWITLHKMHNFSLRQRIIRTNFLCSCISYELCCVSISIANRSVFIFIHIAPTVSLKISVFCLYKVLMSQKTDVKWSTIRWSLFLFPSCLFRPAYRFSEAKWWSGVGSLPGRYLPFSHHLSGLPHAHPACPPGGGLWLCEAAASGHLAQPGLHGTAASVWDRRSLPGMKIHQEEGKFTTVVGFFFFLFWFGFF